ncbi:MAG TPA: amylo-alpha-1,6-glucosidase [Thermoanaerobaculia bacterium]
MSAGPIQVGWRRGEPRDALFQREWLVTNGLGGYASGTIGGACTRRFHGKLIAALPGPLGRTMMLNHLEEHLVTAGGTTWILSGDESGRAITWPTPDFLEEFVLECGVPVWRFSGDGIRFEKRVVMPNAQNTIWIVYRLLEGPDGLTLRLRPSLNFRPHEGLLDRPPQGWTVHADGTNIEIAESTAYPALRLSIVGKSAGLNADPRDVEHVIYRLEKNRGYEYEGPLWSPGVIHLELQRGADAALVASVEPWAVVHAMTVTDVLAADGARRNRLLSMADAAEDDVAAQLVLAADQFLITPHTRAADEARMAAAGDSLRTVVAGYHWFTDWGRDTMISLEGLTLVTGRHREAGNILRTFASYIRDGLIPNLFPEGEQGGLYHTSDATMWFFHALSRYVRRTGDRATLRKILPRLVDIVDHHVRGTHFNIHVDPADGLLVQGAEGYQLTWMDAKVDGWVVTPRHGKAVEINALWYNALRLLQAFLEEENDRDTAARVQSLADRAYESFNQRFWYEEGQHLYDVVEGEGGGHDPALRPNQIFAIALDHPVLERTRWEAVVNAVERELLTPFGLRSLGRAHADYKQRYDGDLRARDAAYHQGTVWGWLIGPFLDAWRKVHPDAPHAARAFLSGFAAHLGDACIGTISEVFDAEEPYHPRGCAAQAWSVAEVLRCLRA